MLRIGRIGIYVLLTAIGLVLFTPFILAFFGTFKTDAEIIAYPPQVLPTQWHIENWPRLFNTDLGGLPRPEGATSLGLMTGFFAFFGAFVLTSLSGEEKGKGLPRSVGLLICIILAIVAGIGSVAYLSLSFKADPIMEWTVAFAITIIALIGVGILSISRPDWTRVVLAMAASLVVGAVVTILFEKLAEFAGGGRFIRWIFNTGLLAVIRAFLILIFSSMAAFAFARLHFPGRGPLFNFLLASMTIPGAVTLIPTYMVIAKLGWINMAYALIIPGIVNAFGIFLLTQFLKAIPKDLEEAAFIDGASYFQIYKDVILPLARPALLTLFILQFQGMWNDFFGPLLYLNTPDMWVLNVAMTVFQQNYKAQWNITLVGAMVNAIVPLTIFFFFSKYFIEGVAYTGVKG
jgi:multiple sugar transport system permease protein